MLEEHQVMNVEENESGEASGKALEEEEDHTSIIKPRKKRNPSRKLLKCMIALVVLLVVAVAVLAVLFVLEKLKPEQEEPKSKKSVPSREVCITSDCVLTVSDLLKSVDPSIDPCVDFYSYACGGWTKNNPLPKDTHLWNNWKKLELEVNDFLRSKLHSKKVKAQYSKVKSIVKLYDFYDTCVSSNKNENTEKNLVDLIGRFVAWPPLNPKWNESRFDFVETLAALNREMETDSFFTTIVESDLKNSSQNMITFKQTFIGGLFHGQLTRNSTRSRKTRKVYKQMIVNLTRLLGLDDIAEREKLAEDILQLEIATSNFSKSFNVYQELELYGRYKISEMNKIIGTSPIDWLRFINLLYKDIGHEFKGDDEVIVYDMPYFVNIVKLLQGFSKKTLMTYAGWMIILKNYRNLDQKFLDVQDRFQEQVFGFGEIGRKKLCYNKIVNELFVMPITRIFVDERFTGESKNLAEEISLLIRESFTESLAKTEWMDDASRLAAVQKAELTLNNIGYPTYILDDKKLDKEFDLFKVDKKSYLNTMLSLYANNKRNEYLLALKPVDRQRWNYSPLLVNAVYEPSENKMIFPSGFLQAPFYDKKYLRAVSFGGIGTIMGHELVHGFDNMGKNFDKFGNNVKWWSDATIASYKKQMQCLVQQYSNITFLDQKVDGEATLPENIADNGGVKQAFKAYQRWKELNGEEKRLPGIMLSNDQVFFISFARNWCEKYDDPLYAFDPFALEEHAPNPVRVNGTLKNLEEFSRAFNCPLGTPMNPKKKCPIW